MPKEPQPASSPIAAHGVTGCTRRRAVAELVRRGLEAHGISHGVR